LDSAIFEIFKQYTRRHIEFTDEDLERIESVCIHKKLRKQQYLLQEGDVWRFHAFIAKGCLRTYSIDEKGVEHIVGFGICNWWVGDLESLKSNTPSKFNIDAVDDSKVILIPDRDYNKLVREVPAFNKMIITIHHRSFMAAQRRILSFISHSAEEKYLAFWRCILDSLIAFQRI